MILDKLGVYFCLVQTSRRRASDKGITVSGSPMLDKTGSVGICVCLPRLQFVSLGIALSIRNTAIAQ